MGEVWRARDRRLQRLVALKILPQEVAGDPGRRARFEQEARALGALNHPNVMAIYDVGEDGGRAYIVSELVEGATLRAVLDRGPLPARRAVEIASQMADGMAAAHALGIVHRDLKPENVMVTRTGQVKLLDFGLAKQNGPAAGDKSATIALGVSEPGTVMGTVGYMSPEQVRGEPADARSDIFSFGCVLYEMLAGKRAFQAGTGVETMHSILHLDPPEFEGEHDKLAPALTAIVRRCLEKRREQRFQSAADLAFALRSIAGAAIAGMQAAATAPRAVRTRWVWGVTAMAAGLALLAIGFVVRDRTVHRLIPQFQRITFRKGFVVAARFTSDGRNAVYQAAWEGGPSRIYLAVRGTPESRDLSMPAGSQLMAISTQQDLALIVPPFGDYSTGTLVGASFSGGQEDLAGCCFRTEYHRRNSLAILESEQHRSLVSVVRPERAGHRLCGDLKGRRRVALRLPTQVKLYDIARTGDLLLSSGSLQLGIMGKAPGGGAERDLSCLDSGKVAGISDDGRVIAANITGESGGEQGSVYLRKTDGSPAIRAADGHAYRLSPDGNWISGYALNADGSRRFVLSPTGPGEESENKVPGLDGGIVYGWLEGGRRYLVFGHLAGKKWQCFVWDASRGTAQPLCAEGVADAFAYYVSPDRKRALIPLVQGGWRVYAVDGGSAQEVHGVGPGEAIIGWRQDSRSVYVVPDEEGSDSIPISIVEIASGKRSAWKTIHPSQPVLEIHDLHVTPDGQAYAYNYVTAQSDLYVAHGLN